MECGDVMKQLAAYHDGELAPAVQGEVRQHLDLCGRCQGALHDIERNIAALGQLERLPAPASLTLESVRLRLEPERDELTPVVAAFIRKLGTLPRCAAPPSIGARIRQRLEEAEGVREKRRPRRGPRVPARLLRLAVVRLAVVRLAVAASILLAVGLALWWDRLPFITPGGSPSPITLVSHAPDQAAGGTARRAVPVTIRSYDLRVDDALPTSPLLRQTLLANRPGLSRRVIGIGPGAGQRPSGGGGGR